MSHDHSDHPAHYHPTGAAKSLRWAFAVTFLMFAVELAGGLWTGSLALLSDALHMAVDLGALGLGLFAAWAASRPPDDKRTFGYHRAEVLAALANGVALLILVGVILREAWGRFGQPREVLVGPMLSIAAAGLVCNIVSGSILYGQSRENINVRAAFLHVLSDALGSVGVIAAGLVMWLTGWMLADPIASVFICVIIACGSFQLVRDSIHILLEGVPGHVDLDELRAALLGIEGVKDVHDLHLWSLSSGRHWMSGHLLIDPRMDCQDVIRRGAEIAETRFRISRVTLQVEEGAPVGAKKLTGHDKTE